MSKTIAREIDRTIGNYSLGKTIGEGTFGKVKLGVHLPTGEKVAIKILEKDKIQEQSDIQRVAKEIQILKMLRHHHIIQLYEIIETPKELFLIMEYANGGELFDHIVSHVKVKEKEACKFFQSIIEGVEYIHKIGVVHRDLKPENLLLDMQQNIKIVDFGLSNTYKDGELLNTACGSPCYAAPEMVAGKKYQGLSVDIWSCGVILFALLCGYLPFEDSNTAQLYKKIVAGEYQTPKFISEVAKDLLSNLLITDPSKRYTIEQIREHPWCRQTFLENQNKGIIVGSDTINLDEQLVEQLKHLHNVDPLQCRKMVQNNRHNEVTTLYYLIQLRNQRQKAAAALQTQLQNYIDPKSESITKYTHEDMSYGVSTQTQAQQGAQQKQKQKEPPTLKSPVFRDKTEFFKREQNRFIVPYSPKQPTMAQTDDMKQNPLKEMRPKVVIPPMRLQFNPITQAVNNSISSIGTNTTNTPILTARKLREELSLEDKKNHPKTPLSEDLSYLRHPLTDRTVVDRPKILQDAANKWNNSFLDVGVKYLRSDKMKTENSPQQINLKSVSQNQDHLDESVKRNYQVPTIRFPQPSQGYTSNKTQVSQTNTINMSYYVQHKMNELPDSPSGSWNQKIPKMQTIQSFQGRPKLTNSQHRPEIRPTYNSNYQPSTNHSDQMKLHKGAFNLQCISSKQPQQLMTDLVDSLQQLKINFDQKSRYELSCCSQGEIKFDLGIHLLVKCEGVHLIKGKLIKGDRKTFQALSHDIIQIMNLQMLF